MMAALRPHKYYRPGVFVPTVQLVEFTLGKTRKPECQLPPFGAKESPLIGPCFDRHGKAAGRTVRRFDIRQIESGALARHRAIGFGPVHMDALAGAAADRPDGE